MPLVLSFLSILGLAILGGSLVVQFWSKVTKGLEHDETGVYGESLKSIFLER